MAVGTTVAKPLLYGVFLHAWECDYYIVNYLICVYRIEEHCICIANTITHCG